MIEPEQSLILQAWISADLNSPGDGGSNPLRWGVTYIAPDASGDLMVKVGAVMQRELMIPDPSTNPLAPKVLNLLALPSTVNKRKY